jgi:IS5 family transposase
MQEIVINHPKPGGFMQAKPTVRQGRLFEIRLARLLDNTHQLYRLADAIDWAEFDTAFGKLYSPDQGRPAKPTRLMVGLHYLKFTFNMSDEEVVARWVENPYWQYFCGCEYFEHELPIDPSLMTKWRNRIKSEGMEKLLEITIKTGLNTRVLKRRSLRKVNVDTTVQEKAISYPTDAKLYHKMRERLVSDAKKFGVELRQSYTRKSKQSLLMQSRYSHARQMKRARKEQKKLKTYLGRVTRDIERKVSGNKPLVSAFSDSLQKARRLLEQTRTSKNKLYSVHAPEVECIAKGKVHKKYEFGCKVSVVSTSRDPFIVGIQAHHGNPFDGHTLKEAISQAEELANFKVSEVYVDRGYKGHNYDGEGVVHIARRGLRKVKPTLRKWLKRRSAIEPLIGHMKNDGRMNRNQLSGTEGDRMNALLCACGYNLRKLLAAFLFWLFYRMLRKEIYIPNWGYAY